MLNHVVISYLLNSFLPVLAFWVQYWFLEDQACGLCEFMLIIISAQTLSFLLIVNSVQFLGLIEIKNHALDVALRLMYAFSGPIILGVFVLYELFWYYSIRSDFDLFAAAIATNFVLCFYSLYVQFKWRKA